MEEPTGHLTLSVSPVGPAYRQVADQLRALVLEGALAPGSRLPNETELSVMFGVGRSTIREALRTLASQNLVVTSRGVSGGTFVAHPDPGKVSEYLEASLGLLSGSQAVSFGELIETRELLEVPAARLAAQRRSPEQLDGLRAVVSADDAGRDLVHNLRFHQLLLEASGNRLLCMVTTPVFAVLQARLLHDAAVAPAGFWPAVAADHAGILARVEAGDGAGAALAMLDHLRRMSPTWKALAEEQAPHERP
jgi:GntR family transcriptional repressor for pyruvate dehydrogenase complex